MKREKAANVINDMSIRGRVAFCVTCIENAKEYFGIKSQQLDLVISEIWAFTSSTNLSAWETTINEYAPHVILDKHPSNKPENYNFITQNEFTQLKILYESIPQCLVEIIGDTIEAGACNIYGGTEEFSPCSLKYSLNVYSTMLENQLPLPDIKQFMMSPFSEEHGWGLPRPTSFWRNVK